MLKGPPNDKLWFGQGIHLALAEWYGPGRKRERDPRSTWEEYVEGEIKFIRTQVSNDWREDEFIAAGELGYQMLTGYIAKYGNDDSWDVIAPEKTFRMTLPGRNREQMVHFVGTFDLAYRDLDDDKALKLAEHKTYKAIDTSHLPLDDQTLGYAFAARNSLLREGLIRPSEQFAGITYNILRKAMPDKRPHNKDGLYLNKNGTISKTQPAPLYHREFVERTAHEVANVPKRIRDEVEQMNQLRVRLTHPTKNPTRDCHWDCQFYDMCQLHEMGQDWMEYRDAMFTSRDPYKDHRANRKSA